MDRKLILTIILMSLISFVSSSCSINSIDYSMTFGGTIPVVPSFSCSNNDTNNSITFNKIGSFFNVNPSIPFVISPSGTKGSIVVTFNEVPVGVYEGMIYSEGLGLPINLEVNAPTEEGCRLIELPHTTTYRIKQGDTGTSSQIKVKVSSECSSTMTGMTVTEQTQMTKPMYLIGQSGDIVPGNDFSFSIGLDAENVATGSYQNTYIVSGTMGDKVFQKSITLFTIVTLGTSPVDSESFSNLPDCTLDQDMKLNGTYEMICNNDNPNIIIEVPYNEFFEGVSVSETEGTFKYKIRPTKIGLAKFIATFKYKGVCIGEPFSKDIRIVQGDIPLSGTELTLNFYQDGKKVDPDRLGVGETNILVKDNSSGSIVPSYTLYINGQTGNSTFKMEAKKNYELIVHSAGYVSKTMNVNASNLPIELIIEPNLEVYEVGDRINITSSIDNVSLLFNNKVIYSPYTFNIAGNFVLEGVRENYLSYSKNITIKSVVGYSSIEPDFEKWSKGKTVVVKLQESVPWSVQFYEGETFSSSKEIKSGSSDTVEFKLNDYGKYEIKTGDKIILSKVIEKNGWFGWFNWDNFKDNWYLWLGGIAILSYLVYSLLFKDNQQADGFSFQPQIQ